MAIVWFTVIIGCHSSSTSPQETPAATPAPAALVRTPVATPASVQLRTAPLAPIQVAPPATFSPGQIPQDGPLAFSVPANGGEFLIVDVKEVTNSQYESTLPHRVARPHTTPERSYSISVRLPAADNSSAKTLQEGGGCTGKSVYALSQSGTYQVLFDASAGQKLRRQYGIGFTLLGKNDPVVDPGLKPEQISIDFGGFARGQPISLVPAALAEGCLDDSWPSHLAVWNADFAFRIMQVAGYRKVFPSDKGIAILEAALAAGKTDSVGELPYASSDDGALSMWARQEVLKGDGWRGLRWIGGYGQDILCGPSDLRYVFAGISNDGRFLVLIRAAISHPAKEQRWAARGCVSDAEVPRINALLARDLTAADPASFQPKLDQLDAVVRSLKLTYTTPAP